MTDRLPQAPHVKLKDVKWRVDSEPKEGTQGTRARFIPYIDGRIAAALLDEWVGPENWSDEYRTVTIAGKEAILCTISVWEHEHWVSKQDVGVPSNQEAQKGGVSDAFKRCASIKWGVGRNVYELPNLWASVRSANVNGKVRAYTIDNTLPDILRQLKAKGFDADGGSLEDEDDENAQKIGEAISNANVQDQAERREDLSVAVPGPEKNPEQDDAPASVPAPGSPSDDQLPITPAVSISKMRVHDLQARVSALQARHVSVADARKKAGLALLKEGISVSEFMEWEQMVSDLERENP